MNTLITRRASVALAAAVAVIFVSAAFSYPPEIVSSFRLSGAAPPNPRGIYFSYTSAYVISYTAPSVNYLYEFSRQGSFLSSVRLPGANVISETDAAPDGYPGDCFSAVDTGTRDVKIYTTAGSLVGTFMATPADAVAIGIGGHVTDYVYLATRSGVVLRYSPRGSFISSFNTGINVRDLAASGGYAIYWGDFVQLAPRGLPGPIYSYRGYGGSLAGSFALPGTRSLGALGAHTYYYCLRRVNTQLWVYHVYLGQGMPVEPASLGRIKALYK
jgi:hypothetical protein